MQQEINNFIDAIQKIATDTEYNGIKLLDGTFTNKYIHYGARKDQVIILNISSLKAEDLGAYIAQGSGSATSAYDPSNSFTAWLSGIENFYIDSTDDYFKVNEIDIVAAQSLTGRMVDAYDIAYGINNNDTLQAEGIEASAINSSTASTAFTNLIVLGASTSSATFSVTLNFYVGGDVSNTAFSLTQNNIVVSGGSTTSLWTDIDDFISDINTLASDNNTPIVASEQNGKLVLQTTNGETIGVEVVVDVTLSTSATASFTANFVQLLEGASSVSSGNITTSGTSYAHAVKVGDLTIGGRENFTVDQNGLGALGTSVTDVSRQNLYAIDVTTNTGAETALMIVTKALQQVDTVRSQIGATMNNLQSIYDAQKTAYDNTKEAESVIRNTDYALEMTYFTTYQIRMQSTIAMLAQANTLPQLVLQLMR